MTSPVPTQIEREVVVAAPVERVWEVITQAEHIGTWFGDAGTEIDLRPGGQLTIHWRQYGTTFGEVVAVEPTSRFAYRWALAHDVELTDGNSTLVEFLLVPDGDSTRVRVVESGFTDLAADVAQQAKHAQENTEGWGAELAELAEYARTYVPNRVERETTVSAPIERVWAVLTEPHHVGAWFGDGVRPMAVNLRPGGTMQVEDGRYPATFETVEPPRRLSYRWAPSFPGEAVRDDNSTLVEFTLTPVDSGTLVRVVETGFAQVAATLDIRQRQVRDNEEGWTTMIGRLEKYLAA